jgi:hypothetical protein
LRVRGGELGIEGRQQSQRDEEFFNVYFHNCLIKGLPPDFFIPPFPNRVEKFLDTDYTN